MPSQVCHALARWNWSARTNTETATRPTSPSWIMWKPMNQVEASIRALDVVVRVADGGR